jgi:hypothetical protein
MGLMRASAAIVVLSLLLVCGPIASQEVTIEQLNRYGTWDSSLNNVQEALAAVNPYLAAHPLTDATKSQPDAELIYAPIYQVRCWNALVQKMVNDKLWRDW